MREKVGILIKSRTDILIMPVNSHIRYHPRVELKHPYHNKNGLLKNPNHNKNLYINCHNTWVFQKLTNQLRNKQI